MYPTPTNCSRYFRVPSLKKPKLMWQYDLPLSKYGGNKILLNSKGNIIHCYKRERQIPDTREYCSSVVIEEIDAFNGKIIDEAQFEAGYYTCNDLILSNDNCAIVTTQGDNKITKIDLQTNKIIWEFISANVEYNHIFTPIISCDNNVYIVQSYENKKERKVICELLSLSPHGKLNWSFKGEGGFGDNKSQFRLVSVDDNENLYVQYYKPESYLRILNSSGKEINIVNGFFEEMYIDTTGYIYTQPMIARNNDFNVVWEYRHDIGRVDGRTQMITDENVLLHAEGMHTKIVCLKKDNGEKIWEKKLKGYGDLEPLAISDIAITSSVEKDGYITAYHIKSGEELWQLNQKKKRLIKILVNQASRLIVLSVQSGNPYISFIQCFAD
jgi:outer membrane protein assembly factor BamB